MNIKLQRNVSHFFRIFRLSSTTLVMFAILILGSYLRLNQLATNPPSLNWDEVSFGYNAHSILTTGKDEFGKSYPLYFRSLDDYKLPVYMYLTVLSEKIFGYSDFAVRFPSAFFGIITIPLVYLLAKQLLKQTDQSLVTALLFAIMPWHVQFSRMAAESTVGLWFFLLGILFFLYGLSKKTWLMVSIFSLFIAQYSYLSFRYIAPLCVFFLFVIHRKELWIKNKWILISLMLFIAFQLIIGVDTYINRNTSRISGISAFGTNTNQYQQDIVHLQYDGKLGENIPRRIFHDSHIFSTLDIFASNYLSHYSPHFLFFDFTQTRHYTPLVGLLYLWMLPFILIGCIQLCKHQSRVPLVILSFFFLAPIPASFAFDVPNAIRTTLLIIPFCITAAIGIISLSHYLKHIPLLQYIFLLCLICTISISVLHFEHMNRIHLPHDRSHQWQYGRKEMTQYIEQHKDRYNNIVVSTELQWPNIFYLYYSKYDPQTYLNQGGTVSGGWGEQFNRIDTIEFRKFYYSNSDTGNSTLYIGAPKEFPHSKKPIHIVHYLDGTPAIYFVEGT